jgi:hypothetical protein
MAVLMTADIPNQTKEGYDRLVAALGPALRQARGFIAHAGAPAPGGWQCIELWESQEDATEFFAKFVHPNLPPGIKPKRTLVELHTLLRPLVDVPVTS